MTLFMVRFWLCCTFSSWEGCLGVPNGLVSLHSSYQSLSPKSKLQIFVFLRRVITMIVLQILAKLTSLLSGGWCRGQLLDSAWEARQLWTQIKLLFTHREKSFLNMLLQQRKTQRKWSVWENVHLKKNREIIRASLVSHLIILCRAKGSFPAMWTIFMFCILLISTI